MMKHKLKKLNVVLKYSCYTYSCQLSFKTLCVADERQVTLKHVAP